MTRESDRRAVGTYEWVHTLTGVDFDESPDINDSAGKPFKRPAGKSIKGVAWRISYWGNADGTQIFLGPARIAVSCEVDYKTAKLILRTLCAYKLLTLVQRGGGVTTAEREGNGGEYRLTIPHDLAAIAKVRSKEEIEAEIEAVKEKNRNKGTGQRRPHHPRGTEAPVSGGDSAGVTGQSTSTDEESRGNGGVSHGAMASAIPTQYQPGKEQNQPSSSCATDEPHPPTGSGCQEEGRIDSKDHGDTTTTAAARLIAPYRRDVNAVEARRLTNHVVAALSKGWSERSIADTLASDLAGLDSVAAGLIGRMKELAAAPVEEDSGVDENSHGGPDCSTCNDTGKVTVRLMYEGDSEKTTDCPDCTNNGRGGCRTHRGQSARRCGGCRADRIAAGNEQPRTSQRRPGRHEPPPPGYAYRPDGTRILVNSHDPNIDWNARV